MDTARIKILQRIRRALKNRLPIPYPEVSDDEGIFQAQPADLALCFAEQFQLVGGHFIYCESTAVLMANLEQLTNIKGWNEIHCQDARWLHLFKSYEFNKILNSPVFKEGAVSITSCVQLVARSGSILLSSAQAAGRTLGIAPDIHIVIASTQQLVYSIKEALEIQRQQYNPLPSMISLTTGASRTADIEKTLVMGAHGPRELYLFLVES